MTTKAGLLTSLMLMMALFARPARAQVDYPPQPSPVSASAEPTSTWFGGQVVAADLLTVVAGGVFANRTDNPLLLVFGWGLAAPAVHVAHHDNRGAVASLLLHLFAPVAGAWAGYRLDSAHCTQDEFICGFGGLALGGLAGMVAATVIDAAVLSDGPRDTAQVSAAPRSRTLAMPTVAIDPNGGVVLGIAARL